MAKLQYKRLESAVKTYGPMAKEGKTADEITALILAETIEDKGTIKAKFDQENANEILSYIDFTGEGNNQQLNPDEAKKEGTGEAGTYVVVEEFRDKDDYTKVIYAGTDVSHFDAERLAHLVKIGNVTKQ